MFQPEARHSLPAPQRFHARNSPSLLPSTSPGQGLGHRGGQERSESSTQHEVHPRGWDPQEKISHWESTRGNCECRRIRWELMRAEENRAERMHLVYTSRLLTCLDAFVLLRSTGNSRIFLLSNTMSAKALCDVPAMLRLLRELGSRVETKRALLLVGEAMARGVEASRVVSKRGERELAAGSARSR